MEYNALIREYSGKSLQVIARVLVSDLKDFLGDWKIRYRSKEIDRETADIRDLCPCPNNPLQIYKPLLNSFPITVRVIDGKSLIVTVSARDTVKVLKFKISQLDEAYPLNVQDLYVHRNNMNLQMLLDWAPICLYQVSSGSNVYLRPKSVDDLQNGLKFEPINLEETFPRKTGIQASPKWLQLAAGINFCGLCSNPNCVSKELGIEREVVTRTNQYGETRIKFGSQENQLDCPACSKSDLPGEDSDDDVAVNVQENTGFPIIPKCYLLCKARSLFFYKRAGKEQVVVEFYESKSLRKRNDYIRIGCDKKLSVLEVYTVEPWRSPFCCMRCDTKIMYKTHEFKLNCGHVYHAWCVPSILKGYKCKVCSAKMLVVSKMSDFLCSI